MQHLVVIEGPTASGKTALAIELAIKLNTVILSADSRQFYKEMSIGTAKPTPEEMKKIPHYFIDSHSIHQPLTAATFEEEALKLISTDLKHLPFLVLVGGSGMFIDALCNGLDPIPTDETIQLNLREELELHGLEPLLSELEAKDPVFYQEVDKNNSMRILRALEVIRISGKTFSELRLQKASKRPFIVYKFVIDLPREILYNRINKRVDIMLENNLLKEVESLNHLRHLTAVQTVGYKEFFPYFDGELDLESCIEKVKQHTRNYAKRQLTWFRKDTNAHWLKAQQTNEQCAEIIQHLVNQHNLTLE